MSASGLKLLPPPKVIPDNFFDEIPRPQTTNNIDVLLSQLVASIDVTEAVNQAVQSSTFPEADEKDVPKLHLGPEVTRDVDEFCSLVKEYKRVESSLDEFKGRLASIAEPERIAVCKAKGRHFSSVLLAGGNGNCAQVSTKNQYKAIDGKKHRGRIESIVGNLFSRFFVEVPEVVVKPLAYKSEAFMAIVAALCQKFPDLIGMKSSLKPTEAYHHGRVFDPDIADLHARLEGIEGLVVPYSPTITVKKG